MAVTITAANYPAFEGATGVSGKRIALYVNYGESASAETPKWTLIGGCENLTFTPTVDVQTKQTKDDGMWSTGAVSGKSFEVSADLLMKRDDVGQKAIEKFIYDDEITTAKNALQFAKVDLDTKAYLVFKAIPTDFEETSESDGLVEYSFKATGVGKPEEKTDFAVA